MVELQGEFHEFAFNFVGPADFDDGVWFISPEPPHHKIGASLYTLIDRKSNVVVCWRNDRINSSSLVRDDSSHRFDN